MVSDTASRASHGTGDGLFENAWWRYDLLHVQAFSWDLSSVCSHRGDDVLSILRRYVLLCGGPACHHSAA